MVKRKCFGYENGRWKRWRRQISLVNFTLYTRLQEETTQAGRCVHRAQYNCPHSHEINAKENLAVCMYDAKNVDLACAYDKFNKFHNTNVNVRNMQDLFLT